MYFVLELECQTRFAFSHVQIISYMLCYDSFKHASPLQLSHMLEFAKISPHHLKKTHV